MANGEGNGVEVSDINNSDFEIDFSNHVITDTPSDIKNLMSRFLFSYDDKKYTKLVNKCVQEKRKSLIIDYNDVFDFNENLSDFLLFEPDNFIYDFTQYLKSYDQKFKLNYFVESKFFQIRIANYPKQVLIRDIDIEQHRNKMINIRGHITGVSEKKPYIVKWAFRCRRCNDTFYSFNENQARECPHCSHDDDDGKHIAVWYYPFEDGNVITYCYYLSIQELNDDLKGSVPQRINATCIGDVAKLLKPGERVHATGFVRLGKKDGKVLSAHTPYKVFFMINNIQPILTTNAQVLQNVETTDADRKRFKAWTKDREKLFNDLIASYAPHLFGLEMQKLVALLSIVGGSKIGVQSQGVLMRDRINVLWVGDPSTGKTELMKFGALVQAGSIYVSGKGASGKGLTALTLKGPDNSFYIEPGAAVLANGATLWFDEADKTDDEVRSHLHECMESGTISITKGGIIATLKAETTINFGANPVYSRYMEDLTLIENIKMPISLLTRFDIVQVIRDVVNKEHDRKITDHISYILRNKEIPFVKGLISLVDLVKYIDWVKEMDLEPVMTPEGQAILQDFYDTMRLKSSNESIGSTPRQYEGSWRFCISLARILGCNEIDDWIANKIVQMLKLQFETVFKDKDGNFNVQQFIGRTTEKVKNDQLIIQTLRYLEPQYELGKIPVSKLKSILMIEHKWTEKDFQKYYKIASQDGSILHTDAHHVRLG